MSITQEHKLHSRMLPYVPNNVVEINCSRHRMYTLVQSPGWFSHWILQKPYIVRLPDSIIKLDISCNDFRHLNTQELPTKLQILNCSANILQNLPDDLPDTITHLVCSYNRLHELPRKLPSRLTELICNGNKLSQLPSLPCILHLLTLVCCGNYLEKLPDNLCNMSLEKLYCNDNDLTYLPELPNTLLELSIGTNNIQILPDLPVTLKRFEYEFWDTALIENYPELKQLHGTYQQSCAVQYVNRRNREMRRARMAALNYNNVLLERYMQRAMHPDKFAKALLDNPDLDVEEYTQQYIDAL